MWRSGLSVAADLQKVVSVIAQQILNSSPLCRTLEPCRRYVGIRGSVPTALLARLWVMSILLSPLALLPIVTLVSIGLLPLRLLRHPPSVRSWLCRYC